jgi:hypothetical protein
MKTMTTINLCMTKEIPLDTDIDEILNSCIEVALVGLGGESSTMPAYNKIFLELIRTYI